MRIDKDGQVVTLLLNSPDPDAGDNVLAVLPGFYAKIGHFYRRGFFRPERESPSGKFPTGLANTIGGDQQTGSWTVPDDRPQIFRVDSDAAGCMARM